MHPILAALLGRLLCQRKPKAVYYVGGGESLPAPLSREEEDAALSALAAGDATAK